jgi:hypothetical protein
MLPNEWCQYLRQFGQHITYSVMSYQTPVAWVMRDGRVIVPPVRYSQTTGRHMQALGVRWSPAVVDTDVGPAPEATDARLGSAEDVAA